jgi:thiol-disulfide isomerase/thioredoxin
VSARNAAPWLLSLLLGCGGGRVDPGFYGEIDAPQTVAGTPDEPAPPGTRVSTTVSFDRPKLVIIRADWCTICRQVEPSIMAAYRPYRTKMELVILNVSDEASTAQSFRDASAQGVRGFFERYGARTPSVGIFTEPEKGRLVHGELADPDVLKREIEFALGLGGSR